MIRPESPAFKIFATLVMFGLAVAISYLYKTQGGKACAKKPTCAMWMGFIFPVMFAFVAGNVFHTLVFNDY